MKAAIFDLGNVIVFFSFARMITQLSRVTGIEEDILRDHLIRQRLRDRYESGLLTSDQLYREVLSHASLKPTQQQFFEALSDIFEPNSEIVPILHDLKTKGIRLVLLSNTNRAHYEFLAPRTPVLNLFDAKILSYEVRSSKPSPTIYQFAIRAANAPPEECFYTDDIPEFITAGKQQGLDAELFVSAADLKRQLLTRC
jgi:putative hydrolase of the HAD superfamily